MRGHMTSAKREIITGSGSGAPSGVHGKAPGHWSGRSHLKLKGFQHWNVQKKRHFWSFLGVLGIYENHYKV